MGMKQPSPISVRPRKGSDLEQIWEREGRSNKALGDYIHSWAGMFKDMTRQSQQPDQKEEK